MRVTWIMLWMAAICGFMGANSAIAQETLSIYDEALYYQPSSEKTAHGAWTRITMSEVLNDPVDGNYLRFTHQIDGNPTPYARMMLTSTGHLRNATGFDTGLDMSGHNRLVVRARAPNMPPGVTYPVRIGIGTDSTGSGDTGSKGLTLNLSNQWEEFNLDMVDLLPAGSGNLTSINCLFSVTFQLSWGNGVVDFDDVRWIYDPDAVDPRLVYDDGFNCDGLINQGDAALFTIFEETVENPAGASPNPSTKIKLMFNPAANQGGTTWARKALTHCTYWRSTPGQLGRNLAGCTKIKFRAVAVLPGAGSSYPVTFEMGKDWGAEPNDSGNTVAAIQILTGTWHDYELPLTSLLPPPGAAGPGNLNDINNIFGLLFYESNGAVTIYIDDIRYE